MSDALECVNVLDMPSPKSARQQNLIWNMVNMQQDWQLTGEAAAVADGKHTARTSPKYLEKLDHGGIVVNVHLDPLRKRAQQRRAA